MNAFVCSNCGKKLAEMKIQEGILEIKCKCGTFNKIDIKREERPRTPLSVKSQN